MTTQARKVRSRFLFRRLDRLGNKHSQAQKSGVGMNRLAESVGDGENGAGLNNEIHTMEGVRSKAPEALQHLHSGAIQTSDMSAL